MLPRPRDGETSEPEDAESRHRDCSGALVRPDDGHGSHPGARGTTQVVCNRRRLSSSRGNLLFSKGESLEEGGVDGCGGCFQFLSWKELGRLRGGGSSYDKRFHTRGNGSHAARPWPTAKVSPRNRGIQRQTRCAPGRDFAGEAEALNTMERKSPRNRPLVRRVIWISP